jgi:hypothetical protein
LQCADLLCVFCPKESDSLSIGRLCRSIILIYPIRQAKGDWGISINFVLQSQSMLINGFLPTTLKIK